MNCCDANGNCNQGRDCPVRMTRKLKPYPHVPPEIEDEGSDDIAKFGNAVLWVIRIFLIVWAGVMLASGMFLWSLFI
jgi:hypothetical protein